MKKDKHKRFLVMLLCFAMVSATVLAGCAGEPDPEEPEPLPSNALTGMTTAEGYDDTADNMRIAAFVVENTPDARPQWGMDDPNYSPDIVLQGEVEGGITRMLWFYADYTKLPEIIGPTRSARPPYIKFSEFFDSIFIHWGMSHSKGDYVGANTIFRKHKVDHINQMTLDDQEGMYDRDHTRYVNIEHRGIIHGDKVAKTIENEGFRTTPNEYTKLNFNTIAIPAGDTSATQIGVKYSDRAWEDTFWTYDESDGLYHTEDFQNDFVRDNLIVLYDDTEYITKENYQGGGGGSVTYCDYKLAGGKGYYFSEGTVKEIEWRVKDGKLELIDTSIDAATAKAANDEAHAAALEEAKASEDGTWPEYNKYVIVTPNEGDDLEDEEVLADSYVLLNLNKGKSWIGWISRNNGGAVTYH